MIPEHVLDEALVADLARRVNVSDLLDWLDTEADELAQLGFIEKRGVLFSKQLLRSRNIEALRYGTTIIGEHASIEVGTRGYIIRYRDDLPRDRMRFSLAHEIGHTYWFDAHDLGKPLSPMQIGASGVATIEHLCDFFARALLLPRRQLKQLIGDPAPLETPPLHLIEPLAADFQVADQAVARRLLFQILPQKVAVLKLKRIGTVSSKPATTVGWKLSWCAVPREVRSAHSIAGLRVPFLTSSRVIPENMVPKLVGGQTERCMVDGRWWEGLVAQSRKSCRVSFGSRLPRPTAEAFVYRKKPTNTPALFGSDSGVEYMYIALPLP